MRREGGVRGSWPRLSSALVPKPPPPPAAVWEGEPSGQRFAALVRARADQVGMAAEVEAVPYGPEPGVESFAVYVSWGPDPKPDRATYEVTDRAEWVRVIDTDHQVTPDDALDYLSLRLSGLPPREAWERLSPPRPSLWSRLRYRRNT